MNDTILRFGYPATLIADYRHWVVLLRPDQPTLGSLVLAARGEAKAFGSLPAAAYAELGTVSADIEAALKRAVTYEKINYLMLMMVDPHVHYHVIPRYAGTRSAEGLTIADAGWPKAPALGEAVSLDARQTAKLAAFLKRHWRQQP
ncbi:histidine triad (HIT) protein [Sphingomonas sp. MM-1]|uniref:HIT family protein n=1 Tax=Sphingomonas sp. MM-1 TaxID=745310 RepID=UPI0002C11CFF|nr:HIT family protein [Sphingomonas sp. MM-1]AGH48159.1 histidine triad (HIT) protein [Sphingomonas sp. MM-1]